MHAKGKHRLIKKKNLRTKSYCLIVRLNSFSRYGWWSLADSAIGVNAENVACVPSSRRNEIILRERVGSYGKDGMQIWLAESMPYVLDIFIDSGRNSF